MTAGMSQVRKRSGSYGLRRGPLFAVAAIGASAMVVGVAVPAAVAEDMQSKQWYLEAMRTDEIWESATGEGIKIALIDTGVNASIPSLKGQVLKGLDATETDGTTDDYSGHGTTMAELIAGTGEGGGLKGLAPGAEIIPMRIANEEFEEKHNSKAFDNASAIRAAADSDAKIINVSLGSQFLEAQEKAAVQYAYKKGKLFFAAVGNTGHKGNKAEYPANYPEVVGVAASDPEGEVADTSQHGDFVDIAAPGIDTPFWCDETFSKYCVGNGGTSTATALASASAALIWSANPDWTANQVLRVMFESAGRGDDWKPGTVSNYLGHGIVRPNAAINRGIGKPGDPDVSPLTNERTTAGGSSDAGAPKEGAAKDDDAASSASGSDAKAPDADTANAAKDTGDDSQLGLILGGAALVAVLAGGAFAVVRRRRSA
ncbi:Thermophilic serine proteinase precursor [Streptomyces sp. S4.7]|uniref:S8 family serine peptidase n=1 Tax=Streptomyces sp. S4.7 TaxID=2705439 RepID=UPI0013986284|nr:S8 family serine peptidase [Streptomyces sp. S4.7]QHY98527.1 Thermophilic serine proteinase precursor [Streptomyces sp. S4.7]